LTTNPWHFLPDNIKHQCMIVAGTGGSLLVIGSAAGVAYMGLEGAGFGWYMRKVTPWALLGYAAAISSYVVLHGLPSSAT
jgi:Na+/H+ antiporter NhaD/arsenite permease-like protein